MSSDRLMVVIAIITMLFAAGQFAIAWRTAQPKRTRPITHWRVITRGLNITLVIMVFMGFGMIHGFVFGEGLPTRTEIGNLGIGIMLLLESLVLNVGFRAVDRDRSLLARMNEIEKRLLGIMNMHSHR